MGIEPKDAPALPQRSVSVLPTRTLYEFEDSRVHVSMTFMTPALPDDLEAFSLPLSYLTWQVRSVDGQEHAVALYASASSQLVVNRSDEKVEWKRARAGTLLTLAIGTVSQRILGSSGDDHRIDWGQAYLAADRGEAQGAIGASRELIGSFVAHGSLPSVDDTRMPRAPNQDEPAMAVRGSGTWVKPRGRRKKLMPAEPRFGVVQHGGAGVDFKHAGNRDE